MLLDCSRIIRKYSVTPTEYNVGRRALLLAQKLERKAKKQEK